MESNALMTDTNQSYDCNDYSIAAESDFESVGSASDEGRQASKNYWFGKKYFELVVARSVLRRKRSLENYEDLDSAWRSILSAFPFSECVRQCMCQTKDYGDCSERRTAIAPDQELMIMIGSIYRQGDATRMHALRTTVKDLCADIKSPDDDLCDPVQTRTAARLRPSFVRERSTNISLRTGSRLSRYAVALKEYCDRTGKQQETCVQAVSFDPPIFKASVAVDGGNNQGSEYCAEARNKKEARHKACEKACVSLEIKI